MLSHMKDGNHSIIINNNISIGTNLPIIFNEPNYFFDEEKRNTTFQDNETDLNLNDNLETRIWIENCPSPLSNIHLSDSRVLGGLVPLGIICLLVIIGNVMVMYAVKMTKKLRGATYLFIVSLGELNHIILINLNIFYFVCFNFIKEIHKYSCFVF
jgi:hypothetical protein